MSTRGTYKFVDSFSSDVTIYIHYDNYPQGAAVYLYNTLTNPSKGGFGTQFIRANKEAEITISHDTHGDTEYQYHIICKHNLFDSEVVVRKVIRDWDLDTRYYEEYFKGNILDFIEKENGLIEDYSPFKKVKFGSCSEVLNESTASVRFYKTIDEIKSWQEKFKDSVNYRYAVDDLKALAKEFPSLQQEEDFKLLEKDVEFRTKDLTL